MFLSVQSLPCKLVRKDIDVNEHDRLFNITVINMYHSIMEGAVVAVIAW